MVQSDLRILGMDKSWYVIEGRSVLVIEFNKLQVFGFFSWVRMRWVSKGLGLSVFCQIRMEFKKVVV